MKHPSDTREVAGAAAAPGRGNEPTRRETIIGLVALAALVALVAGCLNRAGRAFGETLRESAVETNVEPIDGFRSDLWFLPDDPLLGFVEVPGGTFVMGSDPAVDRAAYENERWSATTRQGEVDLPGFFIARFEVTNAQYLAFLRETGGPVPETPAVPNHPVVNIRWTDALAYSRWLEAALVDSPSTPREIRERLDAGWHITLPTEAEWEKAARGTDGRIYPWGMTARKDLANYSGGGPTSVGSHPCPECSYGLEDMSGNVWEFTRSPYQPYPYDPGDGGDLQTDALWVMRGGSYADEAADARTAVRGGVDPGVRSPAIGFRVVLGRP